jgi:hypothetical protein
MDNQGIFLVPCIFLLHQLMKIAYMALLIKASNKLTLAMFCFSFVGAGDLVSNNLLYINFLFYATFIVFIWRVFVKTKMDVPGG